MKKTNTKNKIIIILLILFGYIFLETAILYISYLIENKLSERNKKIEEEKYEVLNRSEVKILDEKTKFCNLQKQESYELKRMSNNLTTKLFFIFVFHCKDEEDSKNNFEKFMRPFIYALRSSQNFSIKTFNLLDKYNLTILSFNQKEYVKNLEVAHLFILVKNKVLTTITYNFDEKDKKALEWFIKHYIEN